MNNHLTSAARLETLQTRFALRVAASLTENAAQLPPDISERLRHARTQALTRARAVAPQVSTVAMGSSGTTLVMGGVGRGDESPWWSKLAAVLPLIALVGGLVLIQHWHNQNQISTAAEIDVSLLADDLPPDAYSDPGFLEFLKTPRD
jgi:hypothetical protein